MMSIEQEVAELEHLPLFAETDRSRLRLIAMGADRVSFRAGETLIRKGEPSQFVLIILSGKAIGQGHSEPLALVGAIGTLLRKPHPLTVIAATDIVALRLNEIDFQTIIEGCAQTAMAVMRELARIIEAYVARTGEANSIA